MKKRFFVASTGPDVGKTTVCAIMVEALGADYWKPIQSGDLDRTDTMKVGALITPGRGTLHPESYRLNEPMSPHAAADIDGVTIELDSIVEPNTDNHLVIEGTGGLHVPLTKSILYIDFVQSLAAPVIFVAPLYLGCINHTLLSLEALQIRKIPIAGILFNGNSVASSEDVILSYSGLPCLGRINHEQTFGRETVARYAKSLRAAFLSTDDSRSVSIEIGSMSRSLVERDRLVSWHPYTQMMTSRPPLPIARGRGAIITDEAGRDYIDSGSSWWVSILGHSNPAIAEAIGRQARELDHVMFADCTHDPAVTLAERLLEVLPSNQSRIFYSDNGSTAVEVAMKMALQFWHNRGEKRTTFIGFKDCYHGETFGVMSAAGPSPLNSPFAPLFFETRLIEPPVPGRERESLEQLDRALDRTTAAFLFEPLVMGAGGFLMYEPAILSELIAQCRDRGVLTISDEVMTGFGRTGPLFASTLLSLPPDMMCLSKGLSGGSLPLAATTATAEMFEAFLSPERRKMFLHGHSFTANPIGCAAALASLEIVRSSECSAQRDRINERHRGFLGRVAERSFVKSPRLRGTLCAFNIETESGDYYHGVRDEVFGYCLEHGVLLRPLGNVIYLMPPYCISDGELDTIYKVVEGALEHLAR